MTPLSAEELDELEKHKANIIGVPLSVYDRLIAQARRVPVLRDEVVRLFNHVEVLGAENTKLRESFEDCSEKYLQTAIKYNEAADGILTLQSENARLREALGKIVSAEGYDVNAAYFRGLAVVALGENPDGK